MEIVEDPTLTHLTPRLLNVKSPSSKVESSAPDVSTKVIKLLNGKQLRIVDR